MNNRELVALILKRGWSIFPMSEDKKPLIKGGFRSATTNKAKIAEWFELYGNFKIGIPCEPNLFFAVDVDPDGLNTWKKWVDEYGEPVVGPRQRTPRGGFHLLFKLPIGLQVPNVAGKIAPGIDLRSNGSICTSSKGYVWESGHGVDSPLTDAPEWILALIRDYLEERERRWECFGKGNFTDADPDEVGEHWLNKALSAARPGNRNQTGFDLACQLRDSRLSLPQAEFIMRRYTNGVPKSADPYTAKEALASLKEAYRMPPREPAHFRVVNNSVTPVPPADTVNQLPGHGQPNRSSDSTENGTSYEVERRPIATEGQEEVPLGLVLTAREIVRLDEIAIRLRLPRHEVLTRAVRQFLKDFK